jgi:F-type H+-transporting ATPase subunit delta
MRGASQASMTAARTALDRELGGSPGAASERAAELFALVDALDAAPAAARALANPNRPPAAKQAMVAAIMAGHDDAAIVFAGTVASARWSRDGDLTDALEQLGIEAALIGIGASGALEGFEDELFALRRFLGSHRAVRVALADGEARPEARAALARRLWTDAIGPATLSLVERIVRAPRGRSLTSSLIWLAELSAARRGRTVAQVVAGTPLAAAQTERLAALLERSYGHEIRLDVTVDPAVVGGLRVSVGAEVLDATLLARMATLKRAIAS